MQVIINIPDQVIIDSISTALEGGSNYWYYLPNLKMLKYPDEDSLAANIFQTAMEGIEIPVEDIETNELLGHIIKESIERGIQLYIDNGNRLPTDDDPLDAEEADIFFQYIVLGEIVYG